MRKTVDTVAIDVEFFYLGHLAGEGGGGKYRENRVN